MAIHISLRTLTLAAALLALTHGAQAGEHQRTGTVTTKHGTATVNRTVTGEKGARHIERTVTGEDGKTATITKDRAKNEDGTVTTTGKRTGYNGHTQTMESTITPTGDGTAHIDKTLTTEDGEIITIDKDVTHQK